MTKHKKSGLFPLFFCVIAEKGILHSGFHGCSQANETGYAKVCGANAVLDQRSKTGV